MKIAITGTIGSGKTVVADYLRKKGYEVFSCDEINHELLNNDETVKRRIVEYFPDCLIDDAIDKNRLAKIVFNDIDKKKILEDIMHPLILERLLSYDNNPLIAEVPLLFESNWDIYFDYNLLIAAEEKTVISRLKNRGYSIKQAKQRIASQMSVSEKIKRADKIIYNNGSLIELYRQLDLWILQALC